ncbi:MAG: glycosyltransferase family 2 protein [Chitinophagaceae bacterium]|nr:glycosyltransferase family 2 protein [Chitinophagaceae bacterium]
MKFSIITPTYNREVLVQITIKSILAQTYSNWQLVIIDDGSTDNTEQVIQQYLKDDRIKYIKKSNSGQADSSNVGVSQASGEYIVFLDSDDEAYPNWLEVVDKNIKEDTSVVCVGAMRKLLDGTLIHERIDKWKFFGEIVRFKFTCGSLFLKRHIFSEIGGYDPQLKSNIQTDLGYRLLTYLKNSNRKIVAVDEYLVQVNIHSGPRIRTNWEKRRDGTKQLLNKHYEFIYENIPKDILNNYAIIAFSNYKLKQRKESLQYLYKVIKLKPLVLSNYFKFIKYAFL